MPCFRTAVDVRMSIRHVRAYTGFELEAKAVNRVNKKTRDVVRGLRSVACDALTGGQARFRCDRFEQAQLVLAALYGFAEGTRPLADFAAALRPWRKVLHYKVIMHALRMRTCLACI